MNTEISVNGTPRKRRLWVGIALWVLAVILMLSSAVYQRLTGPTHPLRGTVEIGADSARYELVRSEYTDTNARIEVPDPSGTASGYLHYKRFKTADEFTVVPLQREQSSAAQQSGTDRLWAELPAQPPAGKLEYYVELQTTGGTVHVPADGKSVVVRFKGRTPLPILIAHIFLMFFAVLWGFRTLLEALFNRSGIHSLAWTTFILTTAGGMVLGPLVQLSAFGEAWTGVPFGWDLTDNKTLLMWLGWLVLVIMLGIRSKPLTPRIRWTAVLAAVLMIMMYLIPHSMFGSELDYAKVDQGIDPQEAIHQG